MTGVSRPGHRRRRCEPCRPVTGGRSREALSRAEPRIETEARRRPRECTRTRATCRSQRASRVSLDRRRLVPRSWVRAVRRGRTRLARATPSARAEATRRPHGIAMSSPVGNDAHLATMRSVAPGTAFAAPLPLAGLRPGADRDPFGAPPARHSSGCSGTPRRSACPGRARRFSAAIRPGNGPRCLRESCKDPRV